MIVNFNVVLFDKIFDSAVKTVNTMIEYFPIDLFARERTAVNRRRKYTRAKLSNFSPLLSFYKGQETETYMSCPIENYYFPFHDYRLLVTMPSWINI